MRAVIHRRAHHAKDQVGLLFTSPHPNSGLPEFGTIGGPSRICPTWAGEVTLTESPRELFNVFVRTRLSGLTIHGRSHEDLRLIRDCGPTLIASGGCSVPPPTGNGAPGRSSPPAGAPSSLREHQGRPRMHQTLMLLTPFVSVSAGIALVLACGDSVPAPDHGSPPARGDQDRRRSDRRKRADEKGRAHEGPRIRRAPKTLMERIKSQAAARLVMGLSHN